MSSKPKKSRRSSGSRAGGSLRQQRYAMPARARAQDKGLMYRVGAIVLLLVVLAGSVFAIGKGLGLISSVLFSRNDRFLIEHISVVGGRYKTEEMIREYLAYEGISEGTNLFSFSTQDFRNSYLERNPLVKSMAICRKLPSTLSVVIREREPLLRIGQKGTLVADGEGYVFRLRKNLHRLPVIIGYSAKELGPGSSLEGRGQAALNVLRLCDKASTGLRVVGIDVRPRDYLLLHVLTDQGRLTEAKLSWQGMDDIKGCSGYHANMVRQVARFRKSARMNAGRHGTLDVTFADKVFGQQ